MLQTPMAENLVIPNYNNGIALLSKLGVGLMCCKTFD